jgi:hypothetical protein
MTITNYESGEIEISNEQGLICRLDRDQANRLVMAARMHSVAEFLEQLPTLLVDEPLRKEISKFFEEKTSSQRWTLKEKFARLRTAVKGYEAKAPEQVVETIQLQ